MPNFAEKVEVAVDALSYNPPREVDENEFIDASRLVYDGVRDIRQAVLLDRVISSVDIMLVIVWQFKQCIEGTWLICVEQCKIGDRFSFSDYCFRVILRC